MRASILFRRLCDRIATIRGKKGNNKTTRAAARRFIPMCERSSNQSVKNLFLFTAFRTQRILRIGNQPKLLNDAEAQFALKGRRRKKDFLQDFRSILCIKNRHFYFILSFQAVCSPSTNKIQTHVRKKIS